MAAAYKHKRVVRWRELRNDHELEIEANLRSGSCIVRRNNFATGEVISEKRFLGSKAREHANIFFEQEWDRLS
jgi:hypothetical protein